MGSERTGLGDRDGDGVLALEDAKWLARYATIALAIIACLEWLLGRTISRLGSAPMLQGTLSDIVSGLGQVGRFLVSPALILAVMLVLLSALLVGRNALGENRLFTFLFAFYLAVFTAIVAAHTFLGTYRWLNIGLNLLSAITVWWIAILCFREDSQPRSARVGVALVALAYTGWYIYVLQQLLAGTGSGSSDLGVIIVSLGNLVAVAAPFAFFVATAGKSGKWRNGRRWIFPILLALAFSAGNIADAIFNQGFTGVFAIWSLGFNVIWLWPIYSISLALFTYSILTALARENANTDYANPNTGIGLLLLLFAGYSLQIPYQHLLAVLSLLLLAGLFRPFEHDADARLIQRNQSTTEVAPHPNGLV